MASIDLIRASNGSGNASVATVQSIRSPAATTLDVDTVQGINDTFCATMGTPHTFTDPITSETITVISEATAVDFTGHVDGTNLEIDTIAPGYTDAGSVVGDIIIIRPTTQWSDNVADVLDVSLNDDGTLKAVTENPGYTALAYTPNTVVANGNRSYTLTFNSVDLTGALSAGMRLRTTRTSAAPTQCTDLESGSSQYYSATSASLAGMTFTDDFTISAWIKVESYTGSAQAIVSRYTGGTGGFIFMLNSSGQLVIYLETGGGATRASTSYQSVPLNKWVHVAGSLNASGASGLLYIDGVLVPSSIAGAANALTQSGNLEIGRYSASNYFDGKIAQLAIYSAVISEANIRATMSQTLSGSETSLVSAYSFNNTILDLVTGNNNDLTANNSAVATNADSPFGGQADGTISSTLDYAIITKTAFSTNTTLTVQVPEGCTIPTTGGVSAVSYSTQKVPYLFPGHRNKWAIETHVKAAATQSSPVALTWYNLASIQITIPTGEWATGYWTTSEVQKSGSTDFKATLSTGASTESEILTTSWAFWSSLANSDNVTTLSKQFFTSLASATVYYLNQQATTASMTSIILKADNAPTIVRAELAYL